MEDRALIGFVVERQEDGRYTVRHELDKTLIYRDCDVACRGDYIPVYRPGDRVLLSGTQDLAVIRGGLALERHHEGLAHFTVTATARRNESKWWNRVSPLLQTNPQKDEDIRITIATSKPRAQDFNGSMELSGGGDWRWQLREDGIDWIRVRKKDMTDDGLQLKEDGWLYYDYPILSPASYHGVFGQDPKYNTSLAIVLGTELRVSLPVPIPPLTFVPWVPASPNPTWITTLTRIYFPHAHDIHLMFEEINPIRLIYRVEETE